MPQISKFVDVVIVGAGHGGAAAAANLRQNKFEGSIVVVGEEAELPYERPPLSKDYFSGEKSFDRIMIRPEKFWTDRNIEMMLNTRVASVDAEAKTVTFDHGGGLKYGKLIWATGGAPRLARSGQAGRPRAAEGIGGLIGAGATSHAWHVFMFREPRIGVGHVLTPNSNAALICAFLPQNSMQ